MKAVTGYLSSIFSLALVAFLLSGSIWAAINFFEIDISLDRYVGGEILAPPATGAILPHTPLAQEKKPENKPNTQVKSDRKPEPRTDNQTLIRVGDRLSLMFYERLAVDDEEKWAARFQGRRPAVNFHQRTELTGVYEVQENGLVVVPLLGAFKAVDRTLAELEIEIIPVFENLIGRFAFMSAIIEQKPVYLLGPFVKPGVYKYSPGMTILHLLAMAGGVDVSAVSFERIINAVDQAERKQKSAELLKRTLARSAALLSERDDRPVEVPDTLLKLAGEAEARTLIEAELVARKPQAESRREQDAALVAAETSARAEIEQMKLRNEHIEESIKLREARVGDLKSLDKGISRSLVIQASADLSYARERLADAQITIQQAENKIAQIAKERTKLRSDHRIEVAREIQAVNGQIAELSIALQASENATGVLSGALKGRAGSGDIEFQYEVVRRTSDGQKVLDVDGTEELHPGDLVRVQAPPGMMMLGSTGVTQPKPEGQVAPVVPLGQ